MRKVFPCVKPDRSAALTHLHLLSITVWQFQTPVGHAWPASGPSPLSADKNMRRFIQINEGATQEEEESE